MTSKLSIWNMALGFIGTRTIASEHEKTLEAVQCGLYWDNARRQALRDYTWNFAQRRAWLAQIPHPIGYEQEYLYAYALPEDLLTAWRILPNGHDAERFGDDESGRFILAHDHEQNRKVLLSNAAQALLIYTADITDTTRFDDLFVYMLARKLAALVAVSLLKNNAAKVQELENLYQISIPRTVEANAKEGREAEKLDTWILARGGYHAWK